MSEAYFMEFKFEPGNYYLAGREKLEGQDVLKIEYYPTRLFGGTDDEKTPRTLKKEKETREGRREQQLEQDIERKMNKTALVTLWVDPSNHQIVQVHVRQRVARLPARRVARAGRRHAGVDDDVSAVRGRVAAARHRPSAPAITLANGSFDAHYDRSFSEYREADVKSKIRIPKGA